MKWNVEQAFRVDSVCPFEKAAQSDTVYATSAAEAKSAWMVDYGHGINPVVKPTDTFEWDGAENPEFGEYLDGYKLVGIKRERWNFGLNGRKDTLTTWVRHSVKRVWHPSRDISAHETRCIVPKQLATRYGIADFVECMIREMREWEQESARRGQVYSCDIDPDTVRITIAWDLDLS